MSRIYFGGSRHLAPRLVILSQVVQAAQAAGHTIHTGCCVGADEQVIQAAAPSSLVVFAAWGFGGLGAWSGSAVQAVRRAAQAGARIRYLAGGPLSVPLAARLISRSVAGMAGCASAVFFCPGQGSQKVMAQAITRGIPVYSFGGAPSIPGGQFVASEFLGFACQQYQPQAQQARLF